MPNKKSDEEKIVKKDFTKKVKKEQALTNDKRFTKKDFKKIIKKELPKPTEKKALPKNKVKKQLPKAKEKKLLPKANEKTTLSDELSKEQKDLKLLDRIKEFFKQNPDKTSSLDESVEQADYLPEYYDLPYRYNETVVKILAQTPKRLFIYWDISDSDIEKYRKAFGEDFFEKTYPVLLVHNEELNYTYEIPINDFANSWYIDIKDSKNKYTVQLGRKFKECPKFVKETEQIIQEENINLQNDYIEIVSSNTLEVPNDHVLFENLNYYVLYRNVKTKEENKKDIRTLVNGIAKVYNVYDLYKMIYKDEMNDVMFDLNNPGSAGNPSSSMTSSRFL